MKKALMAAGLAVAAVIAIATSAQADTVAIVATVATPGAGEVIGGILAKIAGFLGFTFIVWAVCEVAKLGMKLIPGLKNLYPATDEGKKGLWSVIALLIGIGASALKIPFISPTFVDTTQMIALGGLAGLLARVVSDLIGAIEGAAKK